MQSLTVTEWNEESQFATLSFSYNRRFMDWLKMGVRPDSYRVYDPVDKVWKVHLKRLSLVLNFARRHFAQVNYQVLPDWIQIQIASEKAQEPRQTLWDTTRPADPYATLYLLPTAPWEVVRAAYKALAVSCHPDHGGSTEAFQRINSAYQELEKRLNKKLDTVGEAR